MKKFNVFSRRHGNLLEHLIHVRQLTKYELDLRYEDLHSFEALPNIGHAVSAFIACQKLGGKVLIVGDYDADGTPAAALLALLCKKLDVNYSIIIPTREEGYGFSVEMAQKAVEEKYNLIITVDNGITAIDAIDCARNNGIEVIVLDHHLPKETLPPCDALVDPHLDGSKYPFKDICGCTVAFKFVCALSVHYPQLNENFRKWLLDLVAISTVADMMPLRDENRIIVHYGLKVLAKDKRVGLSELMKQAGIQPSEVSVGKIGFVIGPRINAGGRISNNQSAVDLLISEDSLTAQSLAKEIEQLNTKRQQMVESMFQEADQLLFKQNNKNDMLYTLYKDGWSTGLLGLVASRITQKYNRPSLVSTKSSGIITGSGRSVPAFSLISALNSQTDKFIRFGGHDQAAGFSLDENNWDALCREIKIYSSKKLSEDDLAKIVVIDAALTEKDISITNIRSLAKLEPHGIGNPKPLFLLRGKVTELKKIGKEGNHISFKLRLANQQFISCVAWNYLQDVGGGDAAVVGSVEIDEWNGVSKCKMYVQDILDEKVIIKEIDAAKTK